MFHLIYWPCTLGYLFGLIKRSYKRKLGIEFDQQQLGKKKKKF
jgi:hypothetical protein